MSKKRKGSNYVVLRERELNKIRDHAFDYIMALSAGYLMDELDYDADKIIDYMSGVIRYAEAIDDHTITLKRVKEIISEHSEITFMGVKHGRVETDQAE